MKRNKQKLYRTTTVTDTEYTRIIKIGVGVCVFFILFYFITAIATGEIKFGKKKKAEQPTTIQYQEIIGGETFNRDYKEYYVLFYDSTDSYASFYLNKISAYNSKDKSLPFFTVDLSKKINSNYQLKDDETASTNDINSLKVANPTILKISSNKTSEAITGNDNIINFFNN